MNGVGECFVVMSNRPEVREEHATTPRFTVVLKKRNVPKGLMHVLEDVEERGGHQVHEVDEVQWAKYMGAPMGCRPSRGAPDLWRNFLYVSTLAWWGPC